ncbi:MAG: tRNA (adenosine(37)-N6)-threonylcarbamoyltransferase complex dimerization subunit type 1 TsaB [Saprospiraceae bacterium]
MNPLLLHIESATEVCSIAVSRGLEVIGFTETTEAYQHASRMTLLIEETMHQAGYALKDLDGVSVSLGPGSYTSLRVGFSTAKGICYALDKPMVVVSTLEALAATAKLETERSRRESPTGHPLAKSAFAPSYYIPMIDARRMEVYTAIYNQEMDCVVAPYALVIEKEVFEPQLAEGAQLFLCGNGAPKCKTILQHPNIHFLAVGCSARHLVTLANRAFEQKQFVDIAYTEPFYLKPPNITLSKKKVF